MHTEASDRGETPDAWEEIPKPPALYRRFEFSEYAVLRTFLDDMAEASEALGLYPNLSFGRTHVNVTIDAVDGQRLGDTERNLASRIDELADSAHGDHGGV